MDTTAAILTVLGTLFCGFGLIGVISASVDKRSVLYAGGVIFIGIGCALYAYFVDPNVESARLPTAFIEVFAMLVR